LEKFFKTTWDY